MQELQMVCDINSDHVMEDDQIFLLILLLTCVYVAQIACLASYKETGSQATNK